MVVEPRATVRRELVAELKKVEGYHVIDTESAARALERIALLPFKALVISIDAEDMPWRDCVDQARKQLPRLVVVVYAHQSVPGQKADTTGLRETTFVRDEHWAALLHALQELLSSSTHKEKNRVEDLPLPDAVKRVIDEKLTVQLRVIAPQGLGAVAFKNGEMVHAHTPDTKGEEALRRMLGWSDTKLELMHIAKPEARSIYKSSEEVIERTLDRRDPRKDIPAAKHPTPRIRRKQKRPYRPRQGSPFTRRRFRRFLIFLLIIAALNTAGYWLIRIRPEYVEQLMMRFMAERTEEPKQPARRTTDADKEQLPALDLFKGLENKTRWHVCSGRTVWLPDFTDNGNAIAVARETLGAINLPQGGWVEVCTPAGKRMGAWAMPAKAPHPSGIYLRASMVRGLDQDTDHVFFLAVSPLHWPEGEAPSEQLSFQKVLTLPQQYKAHWYAVGISLECMRLHDLKPGMQVVVEGPDAYQSGKLQLMDRGEIDEVWLSDNVKDSIGLTAPRQRVVLYPK